jgi:AGCS family alanine or glycine:cation symporter
LTKAAFETIPYIGPAILTFGLLTFVFSTIIGWEYYGERAIEYLFGLKAIMPYRTAWVAAVLLGSLVTIPVVWNFADAANALMAIPNLASLLLLSGVIVKDTKTYMAEFRRPR